MLTAGRPPIPGLPLLSCMLKHMSLKPTVQSTNTPPKQPGGFLITLGAVIFGWVVIAMIVGLAVGGNPDPVAFAILFASWGAIAIGYLKRILYAIMHG